MKGKYVHFVLDGKLIGIKWMTEREIYDYTT